MIPDAAVEAAAQALRDAFDWGMTDFDTQARAALEAAAPRVLAEGFASAYAAGFQAARDGSNYDAIGSNPYRSQT